MAFIHLYHVGMITGFSELLAFFLNFLFPEITRLQSTSSCHRSVMREEKVVFVAAQCVSING